MTESSTLAASGDPPRRARFGVFELDLAAGELHRDGVRVKLQEQPFRLLAIRLERPGQIATREELRERLWPAEFVDFDHGLNTAVRKLRTALDDTADNPRFIETLARRGYRFIAPVSWNGDTVIAASEPSPRRRLLPIVIAAAVLLMVIAGALIFRQMQARRAPTIWAVAVLPFTNDHAQTAHV